MKKNNEELNNRNRQFASDALWLIERIPHRRWLLSQSLFFTLFLSLILTIQLLTIIIEVCAHGPNEKSKKEKKRHAVNYWHKLSRKKFITFTLFKCLNEVEFQFTNTHWPKSATEKLLSFHKTKQQKKSLRISSGPNIVLRKNQEKLNTEIYRQTNWSENKQTTLKTKKNVFNLLIHFDCFECAFCHLRFIFNSQNYYQNRWRMVEMKTNEMNK